MVKSIRNLSSVTVIGLDIAKNVFQVHGVDAGGAEVVAKAVRRGQLVSFFSSLPPCLIVSLRRVPSSGDRLRVRFCAH